MATRRGGDDGVTLIEVLVAGVVLLIVMIPMGILLTNVSQAAAQARQHQAAQQLADSWIQVLSNSGLGPPISGGAILTNQPTLLTSAYTTQVGTPALADANGLTQSEGTTFKSTVDYTENLVNGVGQSDLCSAGTPPSPTHPGVIQLQVTVTWGHSFSSSLSEVTDIDYPTPGVQTQGFVAITMSNVHEDDVLSNSYIKRLETVPVTLTQTSSSPTLQQPPNLSPNPYVLYPDLNGCIFAQVPVGQYTVSAGQPGTVYPGYTDTPVLPNYSGPPIQPAFVSTSNLATDTQSGEPVTVTAMTVVQLGGFDEGINANLTFAGASAVDSGVECPGAASLTCVTTGDGSTGASAAWGGASSSWTSTSLSNGTHINQVDCTNATPAKCVAVGYVGGNGLVYSTTSDLGTTTTDATPGTVTDITQVNCPSSQGCYAIGTTAGGPALLAGRVGSGSDIWSVVTPAIPFTAINSIACPTTTTCELSYATASGAGVLRLDGDPATLAGNSGWTPTVTVDSLPTGNIVQSVATITCPSSTECLATASTIANSTANNTIVEGTIAATGPSSWAPEATFPTDATAVTGISCVGTNCVAIGNASPNSVGTAAVWTGDLTSTPDNWVQSNGIPASVANVSTVSCGQPASGDSADCVISAESASGAGSGQLLVGSLTGGSVGSWAWNYAVSPAGTNVEYYLGVACENPPSASTSTCAAVGATTSGPVVLASGTGPKGSWSVETPTTITGATVSGIPVQVAQWSTAAWTPVATQTSGGATSLSQVLYPQPNGYSVSAGNCSTEAQPSASALTALPGGTASATIPLGLLPLKLNLPGGAPDVGATLTLTAPACLSPYDPQLTYNMPVSDATGVTMNSVPYGTYTISVTGGGTAVTPTNLTLIVGQNTVKVVDSINASNNTTTYLPGLVQVTL